MAVSRILSFDPASLRNIGWALFEVHEKGTQIVGLKVEAGTIIMPSTRERWQVLWPMTMEIDLLMSREQPDLVIVEKTSSFAGGFVTGQVSQCLGVILAMCGKHKKPVQTVAPSHVKKVVVGTGRATKAQVRRAVQNEVEELTGTRPKYDSEHAYDAVANVLCWLTDRGFLERD